MTYTNVFGGYNINTAFPSYMNYVISGNLQLNWASSFVDTAPGTNNVTAKINDLAGTTPYIITNNNPIHTTLGSSVVIVTIPSNPTLVTGNMVTIAGATTTNGITDVELNITAAITVINSTSFSYVSAGVAGGGPFDGGGNAVTYDPLPLVTLADATMISVGESIQFNNVGTNLITIRDFLGNQIVQIPPTALANQYILYLKNNTTQGGTWGITQLGAGTSQAQANALAGNGTISLNSQINTNFPGKTIGANYIAQLNDRASILVWTGGAGTITLPAQVNGYYIAVNNEGSGVVTINTTDATTIDGSATLEINPGASTYVIGVNANWNTLGQGIPTYFKIQNITIPLTNADITLSTAQSNALIHQYTGNITANITVLYPAVAGQWYVWNFTNGGFTVSAQLAGPTGNPVVIPQGEKVILYSDGNSIYNTPTIATSAVFPDGNVGAPGINFQAQNTTGFYRIASGLTGYSSAGTQGLTFGGPGPGYGLGISGGLAERYYNATNTNYVGFQAGVIAANLIWTLPITAGSNGSILQTNGASPTSTLSFTTATYPSTTVVDQILYSSATNVISGLATANNGVLITSAGGVPSIGNTLPNAVQANITTVGTIGTGVWNGTPVTVPFGGTGLATLTTAYGVVCAGTIATGNLQNAGAGTANQIFVSGGAAALPSWQPVTNVLPAAVKAEEIAGVSTTVYTNPAVQQFHPSSAKFWVKFTTSALGANILASYNVNVNGVVRNSIGKYTITFTTAFTSANYSIGISIALAGSNYSSGLVEIQNAGSCQVSVFYNALGVGPTYADGNTVYVQGYGNAIMAADHIIDILSPQPGIQRDGTQFDTKLCIDGQWTRFYRGKPKSIGGHLLLDSGNNEIIRNIYNVDQSNSVTDSYLGRASSLAVCPISNNIADPEFDRTPVGFIADPNNNWTFDRFTDLDVAKTAPVNLGADPLTTVNGSNIVTVTVVSTAGLTTGTFVTISGATDTHGITAAQLNISTPIFNVVLNTSFQYATLGKATASGTGGGAAVSYYTSGPVNYIIAHAAPNVLDINSQVERLIYWGDTAATTPLTIMSITNQSCSGGVVVIGPYFFKYGNDGVVGFTLNPGGDWSDAIYVSIAGTKIVKGISTRGGSQAPSGLFWSLNSLIKATFVGGDVVFQFDTIQTDISLLSQNSIVSHDNIVYWVGLNQFYLYNGVVKRIPNNTNKITFFKNLNFDFRNKVWGVYKEEYNEIWWNYPSEDNTECSHANMYNVEEFFWFDTVHGRSSGTTTGIYQYPLETDSVGILNQYNPAPIVVNLGADPLSTTINQNVVVVTIPSNTILRTGMLVTIAGATGFNGLTDAQLNLMLTPITVLTNTSFSYIVSSNASGTGAGGGNAPVTYSYPNNTYGVWQEEYGTDRILYGKSLAIDSYFETNIITWFEKAPTDDREMRIRRIEPDFVQNGPMTMIVKTRDFAQSTVSSSQTYTFLPGQEVVTLAKVDTNNMGRLVSFRFESNVAGGSYEMGRVVLNYAPGDVRP